MNDRPSTSAAINPWNFVLPRLLGSDENNRDTLPNSNPRVEDVKVNQEEEEKAKSVILVSQYDKALYTFTSDVSKEMGIPRTTEAAPRGRQPAASVFDWSYYISNQPESLPTEDWLFSMCFKEASFNVQFALLNIRISRGLDTTFDSLILNEAARNQFVEFIKIIHNEILVLHGNKFGTQEVVLSTYHKKVKILAWFKKLSANSLYHTRIAEPNNHLTDVVLTMMRVEVRESSHDNFEFLTLLAQACRSKPNNVFEVDYSGNLDVFKALLGGFKSALVKAVENSISDQPEVMNEDKFNVLNRDRNSRVALVRLTANYYAEAAVLRSTSAPNQTAQLINKSETDHLLIAVRSL